MKPTKKTKAIIMAIAAATGTSVAQNDVAQIEAAAKKAMADMKASLGTDAYSISYTWDPFDGILA